MSDLMMPLAHAHDALCDAVRQFHNEMLRQGVKEMPPRAWAEEFRAWWLNVYRFEREYRLTLEFLKRFPEETGDAG